MIVYKSVMRAYTYICTYVCAREYSFVNIIKHANTFYRHSESFSLCFSVDVVVFVAFCMQLCIILNECIAFVHILVCKYKSFCLYTYVYKCTWVCEYVCAETINILMRIFCLFYNHLSCPVLFCPVLSVYGWYRSF